jgi:hypothetical protein
LNIEDFATILRELENNSTACIVRGDPISDPEIDWRQPQPRRVRARRNQDGTIDPATLVPAARRWVALDVDRLACPDGIDQFEEPDRAVEYVVSLLPEEFHDASVYWQFTASAGIKPGISIRLFFWFDRPVADWELKLWLAGSPVDHAIFAPAQPIYTAKPIFVDLPDPVPFRSGLWRGDRNEVTPPSFEQKQSSRTDSAYRSGGSGGGGYEAYCARIGDGEGRDGFFLPVKSAVVLVPPAVFGTPD